MKQQKYKAVVFDLDGTLLDTVQDIGAGANLALHRSGFPVFPISAYRDFIGHGMRNLFKSIVPAGTPEAEFEDAFSYFLSWYPEHCTEKTALYPGIPEVMDELEKRGLLLGVLSNKTESTAEKIIRFYFPNTAFLFVWGSNGRRPLKPDPQSGYELCRTLKAEPREVLYIGDGDTDMAFAAAMGFRAAAATWGYRSRGEELAAGAEVLLDRPEDILRCLSED